MLEPGVELPPPLMTSEPGSFARRTVVERKPQIINRVIEDNDYPVESLGALGVLRDEISSLPIQLLSEEAEDTLFWNREATKHCARTWLELPWYFAESYFYRRLLEAIGYFRPGEWHGRDPFAKQKAQEVETAVQELAAHWGRLQCAEPDIASEALLHSCLWGNRSDLSNYTVQIKARAGLAARAERRRIVINQTEDVLELLSGGLQRVDFVSDNIGLDLLFDLILADFLLASRWVRKVVFHLKDRPFFVSDAMCQDAQAMVAMLGTVSDGAVRELGARLRQHEDSGRIVLRDDPFWTSFLMFRQFPPILREELAGSELVILKGDVNYRRLLDDRRWPHTTRLEDVTEYFPAPFLVLRTLKGEIMVGLEEGAAEAIAAEDPTWLINAKRGIVQLGLPGSPGSGARPPRSSAPG